MRCEAPLSNLLQTLDWNHQFFLFDVWIIAEEYFKTFFSWSDDRENVVLQLGSRFLYEIVLR
jgi:hypothetical protein